MSVTDDVIHAEADAPLHAAGSRRRRALMACVAALAVAGAAAAAIQWRSHQAAARPDALAQSLARQVSQRAGSGLDTAFSFGSQRMSGPLTLSDATRFYVACSGGTFAVGSARVACDSAVHVLGPLGRDGESLRLATPDAPWAFVARPVDSGPAPALPGAGVPERSGTVSGGPTSGP
jgi:hypothetical protein